MDPWLLSCCNRTQCFDPKLCFSFTYLCVTQRRMVFPSLVYSRDISFRPKYTSKNIKWAVTAAARPQHNAINSPSQNNNGLTEAALLICGRPPLPTVLLPPFLTSLQFWHPMEQIQLDLWRLMEICGKGLLLRAHVTVGRMAGRLEFGNKL